MSKVPSIRLTYSLRQEITNNIVERCTEEAVAQSLVKEKTLAAKIVKWYLTDKNAALMAQLPSEYFSMKSSIEVRTPDGNYNTKVYLQHVEGFRAPAILQYGYIAIPSTHGFWKEIRAVDAEKDRNNENMRAIRGKAEGLLAGVTTVKQLLATWPEAESYLPEFAAKVSLPAIRAEEMNALIALVKK